MANDKIKFALWMHPKTRNAVDEYYKTDGCSSRTEYIEKAILFYTAHLAAKEQAKYESRITKPMDTDQLMKVFDQSLNKQYRPFERNVCEMLYHLAVETAVMSKLLAARTNVNEHTLREIRRQSKQYVRDVDGRIFFEDAMWVGNEEY